MLAIIVVDFIVTPIPCAKSRKPLPRPALFRCSLTLGLPMSRAPAAGGWAFGRRVDFHGIRLKVMRHLLRCGKKVGQDDGNAGLNSHKLYIF
jgi:hypothetical protein